MHIPVTSGLAWNASWSSGTRAAGAGEKKKRTYLGEQVIRHSTSKNRPEAVRARHEHIFFTRLHKPVPSPPSSAPCTPRSKCATARIPLDGHAIHTSGCHGCTSDHRLLSRLPRRSKGYARWLIVCITSPHPIDKVCRCAYVSLQSRANLRLLCCARCPAGLALFFHGRLL
jgi:hypothetical protein